MTAEEDKKLTARRTMAVVVAEICIIATIVCMISWVELKPGTLKGFGFAVYDYYDYHAILLTVAFVGFMFNAIMAFRLFPGGHGMQKGVHAVLHTCAFGLALTAVVLMFKFHNANGIPNLYSTHSVVGICALVSFGVQWLMGVVAFLMPMPMWYKMFSKPLHMFFGVVVMAFTAAAMTLGAMDRQRLNWEVLPTGAQPNYVAPSDKFANGYALLVLFSSMFVGLALHFATNKNGGFNPDDPPAGTTYHAMH